MPCGCCMKVVASFPVLTCSRSLQDVVWNLHNDLCIGRYFVCSWQLMLMSRSWLAKEHLTCSSGELEAPAQATVPHHIAEGILQLSSNPAVTLAGGNGPRLLKKK